MIISKKFDKFIENEKNKRDSWLIFAGIREAINIRDNIDIDVTDTYEFKNAEYFNKRVEFAELIKELL